MPSYLTAGKIKEGMSGTISGEMFIDKKDFNDGKGEKKIAQLPIVLDSPIPDYQGSNETDWLWAPGINAQKLLQEELGDEMQEWINTHGSFHPKPWSWKNRSGFAWHFIPDTKSVPVDQESIDKVEAAQKAHRDTTFGDLVKDLTPKESTLIECAYCAEAGDLWSTSKPENMLAHIDKFHPDKVKSQIKNIKARVKKE